MKLDDVIFFFLRHGETASNKENIYRSWSNKPEAQLDANGRRATEAAGKYLLAIGAPIELVIADSLDRVQESVERVALSFPEARLEFVRALHPLDMGDWTGKSKDEHPVEPYLKDKSKRIPGGETVQEFDDRQTEIFQKIFALAKESKGGKILVGGHGSNVAYLYNVVFNQGNVGYEGLVDPGGLIAVTPRGMIPLTRSREGKSKEKRGIMEGGVLPVYPPDHPVGMKVPKGGSNCEKCEYLANNKTDCKNKSFIEWRRNKVAQKPEEIPEKISEYCCDFFEPGEKS
jgi:broad specificity phosphatase PhoE